LFEVRGWHRTDKYMYLLHPFSDTLPYGQPPKLTLQSTPDYAGLTPDWHPDKVHIGLNPQAVADSRRWPISNWIEFIRSFDPAGIQFIIFGGPDDTRRTVKILEQVSGDVIDVTGKLALEDSIRLMTGCEVFVTNDSGLMHVANAIGVPTIGFYGAADITKTGLRGNIYRNLNAEVYCSPCVRNTCLNKTEPLVCLHSIPPAWPLQAVQDFIDPGLIRKSTDS
ncbi:MAG TPA: glycosyltransferase family 9 protein, partial [bacterium]|nr:glycosyltransferase family 9 protein [bacterium]